MIRRSWTRAASIDETLALWAASLREIKKRIRPLFSNDKILIILEGRDASGKGGTINRIVQHLSPRETRVVALGKPSDRDRTTWYFQRYASYLPAAQELVLFNRSWYNRAGVEPVMGFCTPAEHEEFIGSVLDFENIGPVGGQAFQILSRYQQGRAEAASGGPKNRPAQAMDN